MITDVDRRRHLVEHWGDERGVVWVCSFGACVSINFPCFAYTGHVVFELLNIDVYFSVVLTLAWRSLTLDRTSLVPKAV